MRLSDTAVGAGFTVAGALVFSATLTYPAGDPGQPGPALFPRIIAVLMAAFGGTLAARGLRARDVGESVAWRRLHASRGFVNAVFVLAAVVVYLLVADRLGFLLTAAAMLFVLMWRLEVRPARAAAVAVVFTLFVYLLFVKLLRVPLPAGLVWW